MLEVTIVVTGDQATRQRLQSLGKKLTDFSELTNNIGKELKSYYSGQVFASQGGVFGQPWQALNPAYARRKSRRYTSKGILEASGTMRKSYTYRAAKTYVDVYNTDMPIFAYHTSSEPRFKMPRRQAIGINDDVSSIIKKLADADIKKKLGGQQ